jgi:hypothetical protein
MSIAELVGSASVGTRAEWSLSSLGLANLGPRELPGRETLLRSTGLVLSARPLNCSIWEWWRTSHGVGGATRLGKDDDQRFQNRRSSTIF